MYSTESLAKIWAYDERVHNGLYHHSSEHSPCEPTFSPTPEEFHVPTLELLVDDSGNLVWKETGED